jgi:hypothetical protein
MVNALECEQVLPSNMSTCQECMTFRHRHGKLSSLIETVEMR